MQRRDCLAMLAAPLAAQSVHEDLQRMAQSAPLELRVPRGSAEQCRAWQQRFAARLNLSLGAYQPPPQWQTTHLRTVELPDHTREELLLRATGLRDLPVHLLIPKNHPAPRPAILALHGHGAFGHDAVAGIDTTPERRADIENANYDYGRQLVRRGYVVAAPCFTPFGPRLGNRDAYKGNDPCAVTYVRMQLLGKLLLSENLRDALWALELLASHPQVDPQRLGCVGLSLGGRMTMMTAALSPRIKVAVISGALNLLQERIGARYSCGAQVIPGLLEYGDVPEIAALIAPRPCLWEIGRQDKLMVKEWIEPALNRMRPAWDAFQSTPQLMVDSFDGAHRWNGVQAVPLLDRILRA